LGAYAHFSPLFIFISRSSPSVGFQSKIIFTALPNFAILQIERTERRPLTYETAKWMVWAPAYLPLFPCNQNEVKTHRQVIPTLPHQRFGGYPWKIERSALPACRISRSRHCSGVMDIPAETLKTILALRKENGLEATEAALLTDLEKSKAKWTLVETPRYRRAGRSPVFISGKYLTAAKIDPATGEADGTKKGTAKSGNRVGNGKPPMPAHKIDETAFYRALHGKGFALKISQDLLTGEVETQLPAEITKLDLQFEAIPPSAKTVHVTQTAPQVQVSMSLDTFLDLAGIKA
jgi:hypothetical protein